MESRYEQGGLSISPRPSRRIRAPLFDRLTATSDAVQEAAEPFRSLDEESAVESVRRDLQRLLNTRTRPSSGQPLTTIDFGMPDFSSVAAADPLQRDQLAASMTRIIEAFEPRLQRVRLRFAAHRSNPLVVTGSIDADMQIGVIAQPVSFPLEAHTRTGDVSVLIDMARWTDDGGPA